MPEGAAANAAFDREELKALAEQAKSWPFEEARKIIKRYQRDGFPEEVIFETGYGPSGLSRPQNNLLRKML